MTEKVHNESEKKYQYSFDFIQKKLEGSKDSYGKLMKEIVRTGICTECGTCAAVCPVLEWDHVTAQPKLIGKCTGCGICYNQCPRTITDPIQLMGEFKNGYVANTDIPEVIGGQDGGTVTSILCYLFDEHLIDAAIVTMKDPNNPWHPVAQIVTTKEDAIKSSGSIYTHSQTVDALMDAIREDYRSIAFVGTPCNIDAVDKMMSSPSGMLRFFMRAHILKIGLFCMDSFSPETLYPMFEKDGIDLQKVSKMDINKGKFHLYYEDQEEPVKSYTIRSLHKYKSSSCNFCTDLTAENADISVGSVGSGANKNTVFARTGIGAEIIEDAAEKGYLTIEPYNAINLNSVLFLAKLKKVTQYNIQKRKVFIVRDVKDQENARIESKPVSDQAKSIISSRRALSVKKTLNEKDNQLELAITNTAGFTLDEMKVRVAAVDDVFESKPWVTTIKELFPYEEIDIDYPLEQLEGAVLVEATTDKFGKIYSKTLKFAPKK
ncbi:MAG: 4Fe-4S dicluster domain-containing protein [Candidatus Lokiarchaeota archaeon]|nr:4Fe-4S dicluster domain-containing protein [Candidatus Lokiarchaeota archaeon]MBD3340925.1 4Fe-4S dicluster domain-containing protein [Candidatus Lokiarchaeota archaeon]